MCPEPTTQAVLFRRNQSLVPINGSVCYQLACQYYSLKVYLFILCFVQQNLKALLYIPLVVNGVLFVQEQVSSVSPAL